MPLPPRKKTIRDAYVERLRKNKFQITHAIDLSSDIKSSDLGVFQTFAKVVSEATLRLDRRLHPRKRGFKHRSEERRTQIILFPEFRSKLNGYQTTAHYHGLLRLPAGAEDLSLAQFHRDITSIAIKRGIYRHRTGGCFEVHRNDGQRDEYHLPACDYSRPCKKAAASVERDFDDAHHFCHIEKIKNECHLDARINYATKGQKYQVEQSLPIIIHGGLLMR